MLYTKLFGKPTKDAPTSSLIGHKFLTQGGFIAESAAGRYYFLPLGWRVHENIKKIVKKHMDNSGAQEMITPTLHPLELWQETNRTSTAGFEIMQVDDRHGAHFALGGTAEEMMVDIVRKRQISYKELPFNIYQFSNKFRDELRPRGGLLRVREFIMKDAYSFDKDEASFLDTYKIMEEAYTKIYQELGLSTKIVEADGGYIGGDYCHEFQVEHPQGEGRFFETDDGSYTAHEDVACFLREEINFDQDIKPLETIDQPQWVKTMEDNEKHYGLSAKHFLKNVVYKNTNTGEIIIAVMRGDLEANKTKIENLLNLVGQIEAATEEDLKSIGTKPGYVHSWGHKAKYIGDLSLEKTRNFIGGQKTDTTDTCNVNYGKDFECEVIGDIAMAYEGALSEDGKKMKEKRGIEVGNIFQLGTHYSEKMKNAHFINETGKNQLYYMGCYGFGIGRTMATIVEKYHDEKGIIWPENIAPFKVYLAPIGNDDEVFVKAHSIYKDLLEKNIETLFDDRKDKKSTPGQKFSNHELLGIPYRVVLSEKLLAKNSAEIVDRKSNTQKEIPIEELVDFFTKS